MLVAAYLQSPTLWPARHEIAYAWIEIRRAVYTVLVFDALLAEAMASCLATNTGTEGYIRVARMVDIRPRLAILGW